MTKDKCSEAGKALGCSADVGEINCCNEGFIAEKPFSDDSKNKAARLAYGTALALVLAWRF